MLLPRRHFSWQRVLNDEVIGEKAFAVENPDLQAVAFISRDPQLGEAGHFFGSISVYDFSTPKPVSGPCVAVYQMAYSQFFHLFVPESVFRIVDPATRV